MNHFPKFTGKETIIHYHLQKTGGTSVTDAIKTQFPGCTDHGVFENWQKFPYGEKGKQVKTIKERTDYTLNRKHAYLEKDGLIKFVYFHDSNFSVFWNGVYKPIAFSFIREPIQRVISNFLYYRENSAPAKLLNKYLSLNEIFESNEYWDRCSEIDNGFINLNAERCWTSNFYCKALSCYGYSRVIKDIDNNDVVCFAQALDAVSSNKLYVRNQEGELIDIPFIVCITEYMNKSIQLLNKIFDFDIIKVPVKNKTKTYLDCDFLSDKAKLNLQSYNSDDIHLYSLAIETFKRELEHYDI